MYTVSLLLLFLKMKRPCKFKNGKKKLAIYFNCLPNICSKNQWISTILETKLIEIALTEESLYVHI